MTALPLDGGATPSQPMPLPEDTQLVQRLRDGDESAFELLLERYQASMVNVALLYVRERATAEDVVQETWVGVLQGLSRFEGRSSLKTWIFSILVNRAKTRAQREGRYVPISEFGNPDAESSEPSVSPERFNPEDHPKWPHHWTSAAMPHSWDEIPEEHLLSQETRDVIRRAIESLPPNQREVITLRDVQEWASGEVCNVLGISETNQRVLLHRARSKVRQALEQYLQRQD
jgi:RNA polymerase sigma-70 factor (ECF subfamily)